MRSRAAVILAAALVCLAATMARADLASYSQSFEGMTVSDPFALANDGWWVYGNVFDPSFNYIRGYGPYPAPNALPPHFCILAVGEGGDSQGAQQLSVFSDYENRGDHAAGNWVEANVFQERTVVAGDVGSKWYFEFDAKRGNIELASTALAFIKTLDPNAGYALTNFITANMTGIPTTWDRYGVSIVIDPSLQGQILQFGFANTATHYEGSGVYYDNVVFSLESSLGVTPGLNRSSGIRMSTRGNPAIGQAAQVLAFTIPRDSRVTVRVYDVGGGLVSTLVDRELGAGAHEVAWQGRDVTGRAVASGIYLAEVVAGTERAVTKIHRLR